MRTSYGLNKEQRESQRQFRALFFRDFQYFQSDVIGAAKRPLFGVTVSRRDENDETIALYRRTRFREKISFLRVPVLPGQGRRALRRRANETRVVQSSSAITPCQRTAGHVTRELSLYAQIRTDEHRLPTSFFSITNKCRPNNSEAQRFFTRKSGRRVFPVSPFGFRTRFLEPSTVRRTSRLRVERTTAEKSRITRPKRRFRIAGFPR